WNGGDGVTIIGTSVSNRIRLNSMHDNSGLAIDLNNDAVTANDSGDGDTGPNNLQNAPTLTSAQYNCGTGQTLITGTLNSVPNTQFDIDWYTNTTVDPSGHGEGEVYQNTSTYTTDALGDVAI